MASQPWYGSYGCIEPLLALIRGPFIALTQVWQDADSLEEEFQN